MRSDSPSLARFSPYKLLAAVLGSAALVVGLAACSGGNSAGDRAPESPAATDSATVPAEDVVVLDVRTPEEYAAGHLDGAVLLDFNGGQFEAALPTLDPEAEYLVYCRSGNRAGQAVDMMKQAGITNATNLGSLEQAQGATGIAIVTD